MFVHNLIRRHGLYISAHKDFEWQNELDLVKLVVKIMQEDQNIGKLDGRFHLPTLENHLGTLVRRVDGRTLEKLLPGIHG